MKKTYLAPNATVHKFVLRKVLCGSGTLEGFSENKEAENIDNWSFDD